MIMRAVICMVLMSLSLLTFAKEAEQAVRTADINKQQSSWLAVCSGELVAPPVDTDYGFATYNDGRMVSALSNDGKVLWQKAVSGRQSPYISAFGEFLYLVSASKKLNLVNPSGLTLWTVNLGFEPVESPLAGCDGRVFVRGKSSLACYGINGVRKWSITTGSPSKIPLLSLNDGSLLVISSQLKNGNSTAIRVSPFGELLESITFSGKILTAVSCQQGVLLSQEGQTIGLCRIENGSVVSKWVANSLARKNFTHIIPSSDGKTAAFFAPDGNNADAVRVDILSGKVQGRFSLGAFKLSDLSLLKATASGFVLADSENALECSPEGKIIWTAKLPKKSKWTHLYYTSKNALVVCGKDWSMKGYVMNQSVEKKQKKRTEIQNSYLQTKGGTGMTAGSLNFERLSLEHMQEISRGLDKGNYAKDEEDWLNGIKRESRTFIDDHASLVRSSHDGLSYFAENPVYTQTLLMLMAKTGTTSFVQDFVSLLSSETDPARLTLVIQYAGKEAYDKNGEILKAFENLLSRRLTPRDASTLKLMCDATYEICRFMGKPAINKKGKDILTYLFFPQFDRTTRDYARQTLSRIMELEL